MNFILIQFLLCILGHEHRSIDLCNVAITNLNNKKFIYIEFQCYYTLRVSVAVRCIRHRLVTLINKIMNNWMGFSISFENVSWSEMIFNWTKMKNKNRKSRKFTLMLCSSLSSLSLDFYFFFYFLVEFSV